MRGLVVLLAGCSFHAASVAATDDGAVVGDPDAPADAPPPDAPGNCYAKWLDGTIQLGTPVSLTTVNSPQYERDPFLTEDELTLYFASGRTGSTGGGSVYVATRATLGDAFGTPALDPSLDSLQNETKVSLTRDGLSAFIGSNRTGSMGVDVWTATRASTTVAFAGFMKAMGVNTSGNDQDPTISADGLHLYFAPDTGGTQKVVVVSRANLGASFGSPMTLVSSGAGDADPSPTPDERILLFSSNRTLAGAGSGDIWYITRPTTTSAWSEPQPVPTINTTSPEGDPHLSADGCRIYFARDLGSYNYDLYVAAAAP